MVPFDAARRECFRQGMDGVRWELIDAWLPWGFRLADISVPVHVCHGRQDPLVEEAYIDFMASKIPDCKVVVWPDCGHFGIAKTLGRYPANAQVSLLSVPIPSDSRGSMSN
jgi:pimeloyl-ACP methyl ester carboxylesterase